MNLRLMALLRLFLRLIGPIREAEKKAKEETGQEWKDEIEDDLVQSFGTKLATTVQFLKRQTFFLFVFFFFLCCLDFCTKEAQMNEKQRFYSFPNLVPSYIKLGIFLQQMVNTCRFPFNYSHIPLGIENVFVEGAISRKESAIDNFKSGEIQVMMLSLDHAASGTNLTEATHVILLDPIQGKAYLIGALIDC